MSFEAAMEYSVNNMLDAINSDPQMKSFFLNYNPPDNKGYIFNSDPEYIKYNEKLLKMVDSDGHSGASYAMCLRSAIEKLKK
jgi:hypothetical protein|tara:strand:+ start:9074 stop:9319 length:246 start_codon:yes stop_codon:yes gene_type:complete